MVHQAAAEEQKSSCWPVLQQARGTQGEALQQCMLIGMRSAGILMGLPNVMVQRRGAPPGQASRDRVHCGTRKTPSMSPALPQE